MKQTVPLDEGSDLVAKRMEGTEGTPFPRHMASHESVLVMVEGSCTITFPDVAHELQTGDTFIVPADEVHQVVGTPDFAAVHIMPKDIRFTFKA
ncbi:cupin domain-containing protein [Microbacterium sp. A93]|uniref:cupin domain-containing protein n=1 Tax=Microbacterium sp. A93 TaxID=3450716 RepID=UPI003F440028